MADHADALGACAKEVATAEASLAGIDKVEALGMSPAADAVRRPRPYRSIRSRTIDNRSWYPPMNWWSVWRVAP